MVVEVSVVAVEALVALVEAASVEVDLAEAGKTIYDFGNYDLRFAPKSLRITSRCAA